MNTIEFVSASESVIQIDPDTIEILEDGTDTPFFAPVASDLIDSLVGQYESALRQVREVGALMQGSMGNVLQYFIEGNAGDARMHRSLYLERLFATEGAVKALDAAYWSKALGLTDVYDCMPQARRNEWNESIRELKTPTFSEDSVRSTLVGLLTSRQRFFSERVDGIFRGLSHQHVTNAPEGFSRRMIVSHVTDDNGYTSGSRCGLINDLRVVIARFMGRDEPKWNATDVVVKAARRLPGEWVLLDGGALRIRLYKKGTAHIEVHPDMAWRLNQVLAHLYPAAIPSQFRCKPPKRYKGTPPIDKPLPFAVIAQLAAMRTVRERVGAGYPERYCDVENALTFDFGEGDGAVRQQAVEVLQSIGAVRYGKGTNTFQFGYPPRPVLDKIVTSGCVPDVVSHQFYPTPPTVATVCVDYAEIGDSDTVLEPSAGQGDLASYLPANQTTCVELSPLHCAILKARGFAVDQADFLEWADVCYKSGRRFDRVVMNPPFSGGRATAHLEAAARLLAPNGRLVAVLPGSMRGQEPLSGMRHEWSEPIANEFAGTSVCVAVLCAYGPEHR